VGIYKKRDAVVFTMNDFLFLLILLFLFSAKASDSVDGSWICCFGCMAGYNEHHGFGRVGWDGIGKASITGVFSISARCHGKGQKIRDTMGRWDLEVWSS
jgi:hypothetical protein